MSRGDLQEMEVKTQQSKTAVNSGAGKGDPMPTAPSYVPDNGAIEDLGGPTPENSKPDDDSNKLKTPDKTIKQVKDVITKNDWERQIPCQPHLSMHLKVRKQKQMRLKKLSLKKRQWKRKVLI